MNVRVFLRGGQHLLSFVLLLLFCDQMTLGSVANAGTGAVLRRPHSLYLTRTPSWKRRREMNVEERPRPCLSDGQ